MRQILHVFKTAQPKTYGGIEQVIHQLALSTAPAGFRHRVLALHEGRERETVQWGAAEVHFVPQSLDLLSTPMSWGYLREYRQMADSADLIHYHFPYPFADLAHVLFRPRKPSLVSYHSDVVKQKIAKQLYAPLMHGFLGSVDRIIAACDNYVDSSEVLQRYRAKVDMIPYGVDEADYPQPSPELIAQWRGRVGEGFLFFIGALRYYKGLQYLIDAARQSGVPVVIAGAGGIETELKAKARGVDNIHWAGLVSEADKAALFSLSRALVFPSHLRSEAFGISLVEAAMYARPMISADIGTGTTFVNKHQQTGLVVPAADSAALADAMLSLHRQPELARHYGQQARQRFEQLFTAEKMAEGYLHHYRELLAP